MKILAIHSNFIKFQVTKKALENAEEVSKDEITVKECLAVLTAVEKRDEKSPTEITKKLIQNIEDIAQKVNTKTIVLYPYAHLSSQLSSPNIALKILKDTENLLKKKFKITRAPFGWYKSFTISCKGHPLSELSREIVLDDNTKSDKEDFNYKEILKSISKTKLDIRKLKPNDHRILGQEMNLFSFSETAPGMVFWHNNGLIIRNKLIEFLTYEQKIRGYQEIRTPTILSKKLWLISGHWEKYKENIFLTDYEKREFAVKPMNCPGGILIYKAEPKSYKDLPLKISELGTVHRQELSGVLGGLFRVIQFTQDDAHIYCTETQLVKELINVIDLVEKIYTVFGFKYRVELSTRPEKRIGSDKMWDKAEATLEKTLKQKKIKFKINKGDGAFYGPKIDFHIEDSLNREWQCGTVQLDFSMPERFDLTYTDKDDKEKIPIMIHRAIYGSLERFTGILLEHFKGHLPLWLSPIQVKVLTITDQNTKFAKEMIKELNDNNIKVELDNRKESMNKKIREAQLQKINYIITIGDKEVKNKTLAIRTWQGKVKFNVKINQFIKELKQEINKKQIK